jgi:photosystem II stability/assembly factor-like uncharacterized protein
MPIKKKLPTVVSQKSAAKPQPKQGAKKVAAKKVTEKEQTYQSTPGTTQLPLYSIYGDGETAIAVGGAQTGVAVTVTKTKTGWEKKVAGLPQLMLGINGIASDVLFAAGNGSIFTSGDEGDTWTEAYGGFHECAYRTWLSDDDEDTWACAANGVLFYSTDNGEEWERRQINTPARLLAFFGISSEKLFAGDESGNIFRSTDTGQTWSKVHTFTHAINRIFGDKKHLFAVTNGGYLLRSKDEGGSWQQEKITDAGNLEGGAYAKKDKTIYAVGNNGTVLIQKDGGSWTTLKVPNTRTIWDVSVSDDYVFLCADDGKIFTLSDGVATEI